MKHQMGTYPRGRKPNMGKNPPTSNEAQLLSASQFNGTSLSDVADHVASDGFVAPNKQDANGAEKEPRGSVRQSEGSVLAPSEAQQRRNTSTTQSAPPLSSNGKSGANNNGTVQSTTTLVRREAVRQTGTEASDQSEADAGNALAPNGGQQTAAQLHEPVPEESEGKGLSLMW